jgi:hypothetical protein
MFSARIGLLRILSLKKKRQYHLVLAVIFTEAARVHTEPLLAVDTKADISL